MPIADNPARTLLTTIVAGGVVVGVCFGALLAGLSMLGSAQHYTTPETKLRELDQRSTVYDAAGNRIAQLGTINREDVPLDEVPAILQNAVIAVEDKTFWTNDGVDVNGILRAFFENVTSGKIEQGGSTITQQLVKNRILSPKRDVNRKIREIVLAVRLNDEYSKREILEQYLNTVYFGQGSYGVKSAVERFFLTPSAYGPLPIELANVTVGQAALLAGLISNPEGDNPFVDPRERAPASVRGAVADARAGLHHRGGAARGGAGGAALDQAVGRAASADVVGRGDPGPSDLRRRLQDDRRDTGRPQGRGAHRWSEDPRDARPGAPAGRAGRDGSDPPGEARLHRRTREHGPEHRRGEGDGRRTGLRVEPVQHRDQLPGSPIGVDVEGDHARGRARERVLAERPRERRVAVRRSDNGGARRTPRAVAASGPSAP